MSRIAWRTSSSSSAIATSPAPAASHGEGPAAAEERGSWREEPHVIRRSRRSIAPLRMVAPQPALIADAGRRLAADRDGRAAAGDRRGDEVGRRRLDAALMDGGAEIIRYGGRQSPDHDGGHARALQVAACVVGGARRSVPPVP